MIDIHPSIQDAALVVVNPNSENDPANILALKILRRECDPVLWDLGHISEIQRLVKKLIKTSEQYEHRDHFSIGLAAPQIGASIRAFVISSSPVKTDQDLMNVRVCINPKIVHISDEQTTGGEGCYSLPGVWGYTVPRYKTITIQYQTVDAQTLLSQKSEDLLSLPLRWVTETFQDDEADRLARYFQHEYDHLNGILFTDRQPKSVVVYDPQTKEWLSVKEDLIQQVLGRKTPRA